MAPNETGLAEKLHGRMSKKCYERVASEPLDIQDLALGEFETKSCAGRVRNEAISSNFQA